MYDLREQTRGGEANLETGLKMLMCMYGPMGGEMAAILWVGKSLGHQMMAAQMELRRVGNPNWSADG